MKKKINLQFLIMSVTAILLTLVISTLVSYEVLKDEVMADLRTYANVLIDTGAFSDMQHVPYDAKEDRLRVTVVAEDGSVTADNAVIPAGTKLTLYRTDGSSLVDLKAGDTLYRIEVDHSEWPYTINGVEEEEYFDGIMYAG